MNDNLAKALVLSAGKGTRIAALSSRRPKVLLEIDGQPVLHHNLRLLANHRVQQVWINLHYEAEQIKEYAGNGEKWGLSVQYSEEKEILGTAGAVKNLRSEFSDKNFFVLYGDNYTDCNLSELMQTHIKSGAMATLALFDPKRVPNSGIAGGRVLINAQGIVENFIEGQSGQNEGLVNGGVYALHPSILNEIPEGFSDFGKDIFPKLISQGKKISSYLIQGFCFGIDTPEAYQQAQKSR